MVLSEPEVNKEMRVGRWELVDLEQERRGTGVPCRASLEDTGVASRFP